MDIHTRRCYRVRIKKNKLKSHIMKRLGWQGGMVRPYESWPHDVGYLRQHSIDTVYINLLDAIWHVWQIFLHFYRDYPGGPEDIAYQLVGSIISTNYTVGGTDLHVDPVFVVNYTGMWVVLFSMRKQILCRAVYIHVKC